MYSVRDPAGSGIAKYIIEYYRLDKSDECKNSITCYRGSDFYIVGFSEDVIYFEFLDSRLPVSVTEYIVLSRHSSAQYVKSYTVHHTGNFGEALYGGKPGKLGVANPITAHKLLLGLRRYCEEDQRCSEYEVSYEATHHGPTENNKPLCFVEIGSSIDEWRDPINHRIVALAVIDYLENPVHECNIVTGIGGGHYPRKHTRLALEKEYCYGHIMAKYALQYLSEHVLDQMIERSKPKPRKLVVEKKGTRKEHRELIEEYVKKRGLELEYV